MPTADHPPVSPPRSALKDEAAKRSSPEPIRPSKSLPDPPKPPPVAAAKPPSKPEVTPANGDRDSDKVVILFVCLV